MEVIQVSNPFLAAGLLSLVAVIIGRLFSHMKIPKVTGYLVGGLLLSPSLWELAHMKPLIREESFRNLEFIHELGLLLIIFSIGKHFRFRHLRTHGGALYRLSLSEAGITFFITMAATWLAGASLPAALFLGIMALNTAPGATQMVIREYQSEGKVTDLSLQLVGLNNLLGIMAFVVAYNYLVKPENMLMILFLPVLFGALTGFLTAIWDALIEDRRQRQVITLATLLLLAGIIHALGLNLLLAGLVAGAVYINSSVHEERIFEELHQLDYPVYVLFFALSGVHLRMDLLPAMGLVGVAYVISRTVGKFSGAWLGSRWGAYPQRITDNLGYTLLCQAGIAIGLSSILARDWSAGGGRSIESTVLAAVVIFEGLGPILVRVGLERAGEITLLSKITRSISPHQWMDAISEVLHKFTYAIGVGKPTSESVPVGLVMRRNIEPISMDASLQDVISFFSTSQYDSVPVVDSENVIQGIIRYSNISALFGSLELLGNAITVMDLMEPYELVLTVQHTISDAIEMFSKAGDISYLYVVKDEKNKKLVGVVRRSDLYFSHVHLTRSMEIKVTGKQNTSPGQNSSSENN